MNSQLRVELVYDPTCANVDRVRESIRGALSTLGAPLAWREWLRDDPATPAPLRALGSPSVLINGEDVGSDSGTLPQADANSCRVYMDECGCICGAPFAQLIIDTIMRQTPSHDRGEG